MTSQTVAPRKGALRHPPTVPGHWFFGVSREFQRDPLGAAADMVRAHGDAVRFRFFASLYGYFFTHPDAARHILQDNNRNYTKIPHPTNAMLKTVLGNGLLVNDGDSWLHQRRLAQPAFHRQRIAAFAETMGEVAETTVRRWDETVAPGERRDLSEEMMRLTLEIVGRTLFSLDLTGAADKVGHAFSRVNETVMDLNARPLGPIEVRLPFVPATRELRRNVGILDGVVDDIIRRRRASGEDVPDLLGLLMGARDEDTGQAMDDRQLRDEVMTIMLAGHETTALALTWTFYLLAQHPEWRERLEGEVDRELGGRAPLMVDLPRLPLTRMVLEEAMRLYPPAWGVGRWCNEADVVSGYDVPAGSVVSFSTFLLHRHPEFWDEPERFDPERFTPEREAARPRFAYLPFGGGPRQCIGRDFALAEGIILLATIAQHYHFELQPGYRAELDANITLRPKGGLPVTFQPRVR
jgi:cytochrome P450